MRSTTFILTVCGISAVIGIALAISLLFPYRTRFQPSPPAVHTLNVWGLSIHQEPASVLIAWINREVNHGLVSGIPVDYQLELRVVAATGSTEVRFVMRVRGTSPAARNAVGQAMVDYFKRTNRLLSSKSLRLDAGYVSETPRTNKADDTIDLELSLWILPLK